MWIDGCSSNLPIRSGLDNCNEKGAVVGGVLLSLFAGRTGPKETNPPERGTCQERGAAGVSLSSSRGRPPAPVQKTLTSYPGLSPVLLRSPVQFLKMKCTSSGEEVLQDSTILGLLPADCLLRWLWSMHWTATEVTGTCCCLQLVGDLVLLVVSCGTACLAVSG